MTPLVTFYNYIYFHFSTTTGLDLVAYLFVYIFIIIIIILTIIKYNNSLSLMLLLLIMLYLLLFVCCLTTCDDIVLCKTLNVYLLSGQQRPGLLPTRLFTLENLVVSDWQSIESYVLVVLQIIDSMMLYAH